MGSSLLKNRGKKRSKLAVNNRCNFGTSQICSSEKSKDQGKHKQPGSPIPAPPRPTLASITDNSTRAVAFYSVMCVRVHAGVHTKREEGLSTGFSC